MAGWKCDSGHMNYEEFPIDYNRPCEVVSVAVAVAGLIEKDLK